MKNEPALFISYRKNGEGIRLGPFYSACPDGYLAGEWITYKVQNENLIFSRVTVPWYHSICAMARKE